MNYLYIFVFCSSQSFLQIIVPQMLLKKTGKYLQIMLENQNDRNTYASGSLILKI